MTADAVGRRSRRLESVRILRSSRRGTPHALHLRSGVEDFWVSPAQTLANPDASRPCYFVISSNRGILKP